MSYFVNIDIHKAFDKVNHNRLFQLLQEKFEDQRMIEEIRKMTKVGVINLNNPKENLDQAHLGTAQGSILSPMLFNVYMTELDNFVENLKAE